MVGGSDESMTLREGVSRRRSVWRRSTTRVLQSPIHEKKVSHATHHKRACATHSLDARAPRTH